MYIFICYCHNVSTLVGISSKNGNGSDLNVCNLQLFLSWLNICNNDNNKHYNKNDQTINKKY